MYDIEIENRGLCYFLIKERKKFVRIIESNEKSIEKAKRKKISNDKDAIKFNVKTSECRRNVNYYKKELKEINFAINELKEGRRKNSILGNMKAKLEMFYIKKEINFIFVVSLIIYFFIHILQISLKSLVANGPLFDLLTILPILSLALITLWVPNLYETKCQQYNKYQVFDSHKITDQDIKIEKTYILKGFAITFFIILLLEILIPFFQ